VSTAKPLETATEALQAQRAEVTRLETIVATTLDRQTYIEAHADAEIARRHLPDLEEALRKAEQVHQDALAEEFLDTVVPTLAPLDRANHENLDKVKQAVSVLLAGAVTRDAVASAKASAANTIASPRAVPDLRFPTVDKYRLSGTRSHVSVELCRILRPIFAGLAQGHLAQEMAAGAASGNRLPQPPKETT
jgi:hypothetical protein